MIKELKAPYKLFNGVVIKKQYQLDAYNNMVNKNRIERQAKGFIRENMLNAQHNLFNHLLKGGE